MIELIQCWVWSSARHAMCKIHALKLDSKIDGEVYRVHSFMAEGIMNRRRLLRHLLIGVAAFFGVLLTTLPSPAWAQTSIQTVRLIVDYGDGSIKLFTDIPWTKNATVLDVMNSAKTHSHGITFNYTGSGAAAFLSDIDGLANQGGGADKKNWQYWVNTSYGERSFAGWNVNALDTVFWRFALYQGK